MPLEPSSPRVFIPSCAVLWGYLPGVKEPFDVSLLLASDVADVAVLECGDITGEVPSLELALARLPAPVTRCSSWAIPPGFALLLARADEGLVTQTYERSRPSISGRWLVGCRRRAR